MAGKYLMCDYKFQLASTPMSSICVWKHTCTGPYGSAGIISHILQEASREMCLA